MTDTKIALEFKNVVKRFGRRSALDEFNMRVQQGTTFALVGSNGAGKTTFLNLITGQLKPTLGSVRMFGGNPWNNARMLARIGVSPGDEAMYSNVTGLEWVRFLVELHGFKRQEAAYRQMVLSSTHNGL